MPRQIEVMGQGMVEFPDSMTDDQILSVLNRERMTFMKNYAPGVDKPGLPADRPEYQGMDYGSELPIPSKNFMTQGLSQMGSGAAKMTRPGIAPKLGGASDIFRGAATAASPVLAAAAIPAAVAAPVMTGAGLLAGYGGGKLARSTAESMTDDPDIQNFSEDLGGLLAGAGGAYLGNRGAAAVSSVKGKLTNPKVQDAALRILPKGEKALAFRDAWRSAGNAPQTTTNAGTSAIRNVNVGAPQPIPTPSNISWQSGTAGTARPSPAQAAAAEDASLKNVADFIKRKSFLDTPEGPKKITPPQPVQQGPNVRETGMAAEMRKRDAGLLADTPQETPGTGLLAEVEKKRGAWNKNAGDKGETLTKLKQDALIKFADENNLPMVDLTEADYNTLVDAFNATKPVHPISGKPWKVGKAGSNFSSTGFGRDVKTTLRHFNNMRLGKK